MSAFEEELRWESCRGSCAPRYRPAACASPCATGSSRASRAALEAVRGQGGQSARWLAEATGAADAVLDELAQQHANDATWAWLAR